MNFQEVGAESHIKYLDDFNHYKQFISENFDSPGLVNTFAQFNWEILNISSPALESTLSEPNEDRFDDDEETRMRAEVWDDHGMNPLSFILSMSNLPHDNKP